MSLWVKISSTIWPNRAIEPSKIGLFEGSWPFIKHLWTGERERCWDLHILAVDPKYGGMGAGRKLVRWGLDRAEKEGVAASVKMAPGKEKFYELSGFDSGLVGNCGQGEGNPMGIVAGGNIFFRDLKK
jgi:GNAT superfamily N-acetyltransferase